MKIWIDVSKLSIAVVMYGVEIGISFYRHFGLHDFRFLIPMLSLEIFNKDFHTKLNGGKYLIRQ